MDDVTLKAIIEEVRKFDIFLKKYNLSRTKPISIESEDDSDFDLIINFPDTDIESEE